MGDRPDFVDVQLTAAGLKLANGGPLGISACGRRFDFVPGKPLNVEKSYELNYCLRDYRHNGDLLVELVPAAPAAAAATVTAADPATASTATATAAK